MPLVSLITLNYNGLKVLKTCIESIEKHCSSVDWEWVIAENGSTDGSFEYLTALKNPKIRVVKKQNTGNFSTMNNELAKYATGKYYCFLNNDTEATNNFLKEMLDVIENDENVGVVGPVLRYPNKEIQSSGILIHHNLAPVNVSVHLIRNNPVNVDIHTRTREFQAVTGACFLMRKKDFEWVRGFDSNYHWAYEDVDLCLKIKYHMLKKIVCSHTAEMTHYESYSKAKPSLQESFNFFKNRWQNVVDIDVDSYQNIDANLYVKKTPVYEMTFIVCTHNLTMLNDCTISSLLKQERKNFDLKIIYNLDSEFTAPTALNFGIEEANTEFLILCHHDVIFNPKWTSKFLGELSKYKDFGVAGLAGVKIAPKAPCGVPVDPAANLYVNCFGEVTYPYNGNQTHKYGQFPEGKVEIIDELAIILKKKNDLRFDEKTLNHFHFYAADICLESLQKGFFNVILNLPAYHKSDGSSSIGTGMQLYWREFNKLHKKWKKTFPTVVTTTGFWNGDKIQTFIQDQPARVSEKNTVIDVVIGNPKRLEITPYLSGSKIYWEHNQTKINTDKDFYIFEAKTLGQHNITVTYVDINGILIRKNWGISVTSGDENFVQGIQQKFHTHDFGELVNKRIDQEIYCDIDNFSRIDLHVGTFKKRPKGEMIVTIKNSEGVTLRSSSKICETLVDCDWNSFTFAHISDSKNKKFTVSVHVKNVVKNFAPTIHYIQHSFPFGGMFLNGARINGCLTFSVFGKRL